MQKEQEIENNIADTRHRILIDEPFFVLGPILLDIQTLFSIYNSYFFGKKSINSVDKWAKATEK